MSDDIRKNWGKPESDPEHPLNKILAIKTKVKDFEFLVRDKSQNFPNKNEQIRITSMSDSFVIRFSVNDLLSDCQKIIRLTLFLHIVSALWVYCILNGYTVRGAISIGDVYWDNDSIIGNTFIDVYKLESTVAKNSRIIISSEMNKELKKLFDMQESLTTEWQEFPIWLEEVSSILRKDVDGYLILNPKFMLSLAKDNPIIELLSEMKNKVADNIVKEKYTPLIHMLKSENSPPLTASDFGRY
ncbi:MAG: hypothetical protein PHQ03_12865 [Methylococcales bacterium]|nr:hypothetical protein [Methylococcales bacterium]